MIKRFRLLQNWAYNKRTKEVVVTKEDVQYMREELDKDQSVIGFVFGLGEMKQ